MTKQKNALLISIILVLLLLTIIVIIAKVSPYRCCACLPDRYVLYPISLTLLENHWSQYIDCHCPFEMGCALSFWVIPIDLIGLVAVLSGMLFYKLKKKR